MAMSGLDQAELELCRKLVERLPEDKVYILGKVVSFLNIHRRLDSLTVIAMLRDHVKRTLLCQEILGEVKKYGEPIHSVQEVLATVENDERYTNLLTTGDPDLIKGFVRGYLIKMDPKTDGRYEKCVETLMKEVENEIAECDLPKSMVDKNEEELLEEVKGVQIPESFSVYYL